MRCDRCGKVVGKVSGEKWGKTCAAAGHDCLANFNVELSRVGCGGFGREGACVIDDVEYGRVCWEHVSLFVFGGGGCPPLLAVCAPAFDGSKVDAPAKETGGFCGGGAQGALVKVDGICPWDVAERDGLGEVEERNDPWEGLGVLNREAHMVGRGRRSEAEGLQRKVGAGFNLLAFRLGEAVFGQPARMFGVAKRARPGRPSPCP
jgi:hypothetical protein